MLHPFVWKICVNPDACDLIVKAKFLDQAESDISHTPPSEISMECPPVYDGIGGFRVPFSFDIIISRFPVKIDTHVAGDPAVRFDHIPFLCLNIIPDRIRIRIVFGPLCESLFFLKISPHRYDLSAGLQLIRARQF